MISEGKKYFPSQIINKWFIVCERIMIEMKKKIASMKCEGEKKYQTDEIINHNVVY